METILNPETIAALREMDEPGSSEFLREVISAYQGDTRLRMEAVKVCHASGDFPGLAKAAHSIKGSSLNIGAERMAALMQALERDAKMGRSPGTAALAEAALEFERVVRALEACV